MENARVKKSNRRLHNWSRAEGDAMDYRLAEVMSSAINVKWNENKIQSLLAQSSEKNVTGGDYLEITGRVSSALKTGEQFPPIHGMSPWFGFPHSMLVNGPANQPMNFGATNHGLHLI